MDSQGKKTILCFLDYFYPAFQSGGPARSSLGIVEYLQPFYDLKIITRDRDHHDTATMKGIEMNKWNSIKSISVFYLNLANYQLIYSAIRQANANIYYFNSFFSLKFTLLPLLFIKMRLRPERIIIAPRGEFSPGAINLKGFKKRTFIRFSKWLYKKVIFHASSEIEKQNIKAIIPNADVMIALNLRPHSEFADLKFAPATKKVNSLRLVFLSRIERKKNLNFALQTLEACRQNVSLDIYGMIDDTEYWKTCAATIERLNKKPNITIEYKGVALSENSFSIISGYDMMLFTSLGENFSHSVLESFMSSRPALISDTTYWRDLANRNAGWDFPLDRPELFTEKIDEIAQMDKENFEEYCRGAYQIALNYFNNPDQVEDYKILFG